MNNPLRLTLIWILILYSHSLPGQNYNSRLDIVALDTPSIDLILEGQIWVDSFSQLSKPEEILHQHFQKITSLQLGSSEHAYWLQFKIQNRNNQEGKYWLQAGVFDSLLLIQQEESHLKIQQRGLLINYSPNEKGQFQNLIAHKYGFALSLPPHSTSTFYLRIKNIVRFESTLEGIRLLAQEEHNAMSSRQTIYFSIFSAFFFGILLFLTIFSLSQYVQIKDKGYKETAFLKKRKEYLTKLYTNISHESRTPLTVIMGAMQQIKGHPRERELIQRNSHQLLKLINQVLDVNKIEANKMVVNWQQGDVMQYIRYCVEPFEILARKKAQSFELVCLPKQLVMDFDVDKLQKIANNLVSNAIKLTPKKGEQDALAASVDTAELLGKLQHQLSQANNWSATFISGFRKAESLKKLDASEQENEIFVHPSGFLELRQNLLPLNKKLDKLGHKQVRQAGYQITSYQIGSDSLETVNQKSYLKEYFSRGQFENLSDDEKLSTADFEMMSSGIAVKADKAYDFSSEFEAVGNVFEEIVLYGDPKKAVGQNWQEDKQGNVLANQQMIQSDQPEAVFGMVEELPGYDHNTNIPDQECKVENNVIRIVNYGEGCEAPRYPHDCCTGFEQGECADFRCRRGTAKGPSIGLLSNHSYVANNYVYRHFPITISTQKAHANVASHHIEVYNNTLVEISKYAVTSGGAIWIVCESDQTLSDVNVFDNSIIDSYTGGIALSYPYTPTEQGAIRKVSIHGNTIKGTCLAKGRIIDFTTDANGIKTPIYYNKCAGLLVDNKAYPDPGDRFKNIRIEHNYFASIKHYAIWLDIGSRNLQFINNRFKDYETALFNLQCLATNPPSCSGKEIKVYQNNSPLTFSDYNNRLKFLIPNNAVLDNYCLDCKTINGCAGNGTGDMVSLQNGQLQCQ